MKLIRLFLLALVCAFAQLGKAKTYRVLFIGNSYTAFNNLAGMVADLALANGDTLIYTTHTPGGAQLIQHASNNTVLNYIAQGNWDYVVLQEQSQKPSFPDWQVQQDVFPYAQALCDSIRSANPCTEPVFYMTWGRKNGDAMNCPNWPPVCTFDGMQARLRSSYMQMGVDNSATVSPVGAAWKLTRDSGYLPDLYTADESHPSIHGSYLAACVFYATLFETSPQGNSYTSTLSTGDAQFLQDMAHTTVIDSLDTWRIGANRAKAGFSYSVPAQSQTVAFADTSTNATSWQWTFGDGNTGNGASPTHTYATQGLFEVCQYASNGCTADTMCQQVDVQCAAPTLMVDAISNGFVGAFEAAVTGADSVVWDFGDGATGTGLMLSHAYASEGTYTVCAIAISGCGNDTVCTTVDIECLPPVVQFATDTNQLSATFTAVDLAGASYAWDFGDGFTGPNAQNIQHTYAQAGTYWVCVTATNSCGNDTYCDSITVACPLPIAGFNFDTTQLSVAFANQSAAAVSYQWDFGDGNSSQQIDPVHVYDSAGTYLVTLEATSPCGTHSASSTVVVQAVETGISNGSHRVFELVPNPANAFVFVRAKNAYSPQPMRMLDVSGRTVMYTTLKPNTAVSLADLSPGLYFCHLGEGSTATVYRLVVQ